MLRGPNSQHLTPRGTSAFRVFLGFGDGGSSNRLDGAKERGLIAIRANLAGFVDELLALGALVCP